MSALLSWLESLSPDDWDARPAGAWEGSPPADPATLASVEDALGVALPAEHRELLLASDGGELSGPESSVTIAPVDDLVRRNADGRFRDAFPGMVTLGDDGGGALYFYDPQDSLGRGAWAVYWVAWSALGVSWARFAGADLADVLRRVADGVSFFDEPRLGGEH
ncbi:SMI1/KNR4 family protein [uncultured Cellulomonas sp.]|uniref:SMI1/KNR4 family protein n=1 Tax=uncultured Cellulomonas sp. TaxID=189682 RepID=UPI0028EA6093|nr:SMI1/KNR4 family protein [uncultured Cellulomonas sp.]